MYPHPAGAKVPNRGLGRRVLALLLYVNAADHKSIFLSKWRSFLKKS